MSLEDVSHALPFQAHQEFLIVSVQTDLSLATLERFTEAMLDRIQKTGARGVILNLQEVSILDITEFRQLGAMGAMAHVMGAQLFITGLRPGVVASLVKEDIDLAQYRIAGSVEDAMALSKKSR